VSELTESILCRALLAQRVALRNMEPSAALDARFEHSLEAWRTQRLRSGKWRRLQWALAAAVAGVLVLSTGWLVLHVGERPARAVVPDSQNAKLAAEEPAMLRVRASLGAQLPVRGGNGFLSHPRHYWVDVDVAGDGTLYIKRVTPIDDDPQLFVP
jgi:hypothetical protein